MQNQKVIILSQLKKSSFDAPEEWAYHYLNPYFMDSRDRY